MEQIIQLYRTLLGREPDAGGLQYYQSQMAQGKSLQDISNAIMTTQEYKQRQANPAPQPVAQPTAQPAYQPAPVVQPTAQPVAQPVTPQPVAQTAPQTGLLNVQDPISSLYTSLLGRAPDAAGLQYWNQQLSSGKTLQDVQNAIKQTAEYKQKTGAVSPNTPVTPSNPVAPNTSNVTNPNTATLGTGQTSNPYANSANPYIQAAQATTMGNMYGAQAATQANRINQNTPYASLNYTQGVDANGNPTWTANQSLAQPLQSSLSNIQGRLAQTTANPFDTSAYQAQTGQGYTGMEGWDKATGLINQRLQPQIEQSNERLQAQLANQGIVPGTEAYNRAMTQQGQKTNDLMTQAQLAGSQVQNQLQNQSLAQQQANNAALQQNYTQNYAAYNNPLQQLGAFQQATTPGYVNPYSQAAVAGPDYLGAYTTANAAAIAAQNAANARTANTQSGLYGLGSAALLGSGGLSGLTGLGASGISGLSNLFGNNGLNNPFTSSTDYMSNIGATGSGMFNQSMSSNDYLNNLYGDLGIFS